MTDEEPRDDDPTPSTNTDSALFIGPVLGVMIGLVVFKLLPGGTSIWIGLAIVLVVVAVATYAGIEISRRRHHRS
jgi:uncharacterized membrane protein YccC